jgi:hypothetical protein
MKTKVLNWILMSTLAVGLGLSVVSCSDDDDKDDGSEEVGGKSEMGGQVNDDAMALASILRYLCDYTEETVSPSILNQQFEPVLGSVDDESQPTVRTMVTGTQDAADTFASKMLATLGINSSQPDGFVYRNDAIGSISYHHGTGNELGVISFDVKQMPHLSKFVFTATGKNNDGKTTPPYYSEGDVIKYRGRIWICVDVYGSDLALDSWVSFDDYTRYSTLSTNTCKWSFTGDDRYYDQKHATDEQLYYWLQRFILDRENYNKILLGLKNQGLGKSDICQVLPYNDEERVKLIKNLIKDPKQIILEAWETLPGEENNRLWNTECEFEEVKDKSPKYKICKFKPKGLMLCNTMRWSGFIGTYHYWVPYLVLVSSPDIFIMRDLMDKVESQSTLSESHFRYDARPALEINEPGIASGKVTPYRVAIHWTHSPFSLGKDNPCKYYGLLDFTTLPNVAENTDWTNRNITSQFFATIDQGKEIKNSEMIYHPH